MRKINITLDNKELHRFTGFLNEIGIFGYDKLREVIDNTLPECEMNELPISTIYRFKKNGEEFGSFVITYMMFGMYDIQGEFEQGEYEPFVKHINAALDKLEVYLEENK